MMALRSIAVLSAAILLPLVSGADDQWVIYDGFDGPGKGKHVVLVSGDEEYRSEEALPQLGKILAKHHGFKCTVLFAIDKDGTINPGITNNIPGLEALKTADLMIIATRFRSLPDDQMKFIDDYVQSNKPIIGMRTATHAFNIKNEAGPYAKYSYNSSDASFKGGFGKQILGETWVAHHGGHGSQSTRGLLAEGAKDNPILKGIKDGDIWGPTDVYTVKMPLADQFKPLVLGEVLVGMKSNDAPLPGPKNNPMMPVAWISEKPRRVFTTTMGSSTDLESEGVRRVLVNAAYWCTGLEDKIADKSNVEIVGEYKPSPFKFGGHVKGLKPADHALTK